MEHVASHTSSRSTGAEQTHLQLVPRLGNGSDLTPQAALHLSSALPPALADGPLSALLNIIAIAPHTPPPDLPPVVVTAVALCQDMASTSHSTESSESGAGSRMNSSGLLMLIPDTIDIEEEARFYDDIVDVSH